MGRIWKITMVLLSTLAALVIIVHSAEEDYEAEFSNRRELRHRMLDTGPPRIYDQVTINKIEIRIILLIVTIL